MKMVAKLSTRTLSLADLKPAFEYQCLTPRQRVFIDTLLTLGESSGTYDALLATRVAFPNARPSSIVVRASQVQSHPKVKRLLNIYFGRPEVDDDPFFDELKAAIRKSIRRDGGLSVATLKAIQFYEARTGLKAVASEPEPEQPATPTAAAPAKYFVGQRITETDDAGVKHVAVIQEVNAEGMPTKWEEVAQ
jgi:hypothetical protein